MLFLPIVCQSPFSIATFKQKLAHRPYWFIIPPTSAEDPRPMSDNPLVATHLHIYPTYIVTTQERLLSGRRRSDKQIRNQRNLLNNKHTGALSVKAKKRIKNAVNWMVASAQWKRIFDKKSKKHYLFKVNLITLTLPVLDHGISDADFKSKLLKRFVNACRYHYGLNNYVWKVEAQANGNIHAHFTTDTFIHYKLLRRTWNGILAREGLIDKFEAIHGHRDPNSTDVKAVRNIKNLAAYLAKYFAKNETDKRRIKGRIWFCSQPISDRNSLKAETDPLDQKGLLRCLFQSGIKHKVIESNPNSLGLTRRVGELFLIKPSQWRDLISGPLRQLYDDHRLRIRNSLQRVLDFNKWDDLYEISIPTKRIFPITPIPPQDNTPSQMSLTLSHV